MTKLTRKPNLASSITVSNKVSLDNDVPLVVLKVFFALLASYRSSRGTTTILTLPLKTLLNEVGYAKGDKFILEARGTAARYFAKTTPVFVYQSLDGDVEILPGFVRQAFRITDSAEITLNKLAADRLLEVDSGFSLLKWSEVLQLTSFHSVLLYILICQIAKLKQDSARTFSLDEICSKLRIRQNTPANILQTLRNTSALIERDTTFRFKLTPIKEGRRVVAVRFDKIKRRQARLK